MSLPPRLIERAGTTGREPFGGVLACPQHVSVNAKKVVPIEGAVERPAKRPRVLAGLAPYEGHAPVFGAGCNACLKCGDVSGRTSSAGEVCGGPPPGNYQSFVNGWCVRQWDFGWFGGSPRGSAPARPVLPPL